MYNNTGGSSTGGGGGGYYSSNAGSTSSSATRQRLGLNKQSTKTTTANINSGMSSSADDWFGSSNTNTSSAPPPPPPPAPPAAPSSGSGFYSSTNTHTTSTARGNDMYSNYGASNLYGGGNSGTAYSGYGNIQTNTNNAMSGSMSGSMGGTLNSTIPSSSIPPASAFGSNPNSGSTGQIQMNNSYEMSGTMGGPIGGGISSSSAAPTPNVFDPNAAVSKKTDTSNNNTMASSSQYNEEDYDNEPPLLEELGVNFPHIYSKSRAVLFPFGKHAKSLESGLIENDADLAGPLAFALGLGGELLLSGKMHFGYVYGFGVSGCLAMTLLLNLLNPNGAVSIWTVVSILGYALLPVNLLAGINVLVRVHKLGVWGTVVAVLTIVWCTTASARLFERGCNMRAQRFLVAYPTALLYSAFVMITIF